MAKKRRTYTPEFKAEAVKLVTEQGYSVADAALSWLGTDNLADRTRTFFDAKANPLKTVLPDDNYLQGAVQRLQRGHAVHRRQRRRHRLRLRQPGLR